MRDDHDTPAQFARVVARPATPPPPPPMPSAVPAPPAPPPAAGGTVSTQSTSARPAPPKGWEIDADQIGAFTHAVGLVRDRLREVQAKVDRMQTESFTPKLGTSPVGVQLEEKFADRLDLAVDDPKSPTYGGLRPMLAVAMHRMEEFVAGAEAAVKVYKDMDSSVIRPTTPTT
jgi:hypothetical protein